MSYAIIRSIKVKDGKVFIHSTDNNVSPYHWHEWECQSLGKILREQGQDAFDLEVLKQYENGNFQRGKNKYTRALEILRHYAEYKNFDWRGENDENRKSPAFVELLKRALSERLPKDRFIVFKPYNGSFVYLYKRTKKFAKWTYDKTKAKIFRYEDDANWIKKCFYDSEDWSVEKL